MEKPNVDEHYFPAMDKLLQRQSAIQRKLAHQHLQSRSQARPNTNGRRVDL